MFVVYKLSDLFFYIHARSLCEFQKSNMSQQVSVESYVTVLYEVFFALIGKTSP